MLTRKLVIFGVLLVGVVAAASYWLVRAPEKVVGTVTASMNAESDGDLQAGAQAVQSAGADRQAQDDSAEKMSVVSRSEQLRHALERSTDYLSFAESLISAARGGDPDAQYYLYATLRYCDEGYRAYFQTAQGMRSLDAALLAESGQRIDRSEQIKIVHARCNGLKATSAIGYGDAREWLAKATAAGQPVAQATTALLLFNAQTLEGFRAAGGVVRPETVETPEVNPRALLRAAVRSRDPSVLWRIGEMQGRLAEGSDAAVPSEPGDPYPSLKKQFAWWLVACERGYDCGEDADWLATMCSADPSCQPGESGVDYIRRSARTLNYYDLDEQVRELRTRLANGQWDALGLEG